MIAKLISTEADYHLSHSSADDEHDISGKLQNWNASNMPNQPDHVSYDEIYQIDKVLKTRLRKGQKEYLVKWLGFPNEQNSWYR